MCAKTKRLLITTEKHELFIVHLKRPIAQRGFCPECGEEVDLMTLEAVVDKSEIGGYQMLRRIAAGEIHSIESSSGQVLVCRNSLARVTGSKT
jgi:hypothetical protein